MFRLFNLGYRLGYRLGRLAILSIMVASNAQNISYRFSGLNTLYYESFYNHPVFSHTCCIAHFTPISDRRLLFQFNWLDSSKKLSIQKGEMFFQNDYKFKNCFLMNPVQEGVSELCIQETGNHQADFLIITDKLQTFFYGYVKNFSSLPVLEDRMRYYTDTVVPADCHYNEVEPNL